MNRRDKNHSPITLAVCACAVALIALPCIPLSRGPQHADRHRAMHRFIATSASAGVISPNQMQVAPEQTPPPVKLQPEAQPPAVKSPVVENPPQSTPKTQTPAPQPPGAQSPLPQSGTGTYTDFPWPRSAKLRIQVIDGRTLKPLSGAEVVVIESEQRVRTEQSGYTPWFDAPLIRDPRYRPLVAELHGQIGVIVYKNGYRDSVHLGIRLNPNVRSETTVWMYKLGPGDDRVEPVLYEVPYHHLWLIRLADRFRDSSQLGEGFQHP